jgi:hypothetical protein
MEYHDKETFLTLKSHNSERFADTDFQLRSGVHIQEHKSQYKNFRFIEDNIHELQKFYNDLYQVQLCFHQSNFGKFYYLDYLDEQRARLRRKSLEPDSTLFAIFLYTFHKTEKRFSTTLTKPDVMYALNNHSKIKSRVQKLFLGSESEETITTNKTIERWVTSSLNDLEKLGWILFEENSENDSFEILPAFERIALIYQEPINNIDEIDTFIK